MKKLPRKIIVNVGQSPTLIRLVDKLLTDKGLVHQPATSTINMAVERGSDRAHRFDLDNPVSWSNFDEASYYIKNLDTEFKGYTVIDAATQMGFLIEVIEGSKKIEVKLNDKYTAVVNEDGTNVKVGCQDFSFDSVASLYSAMKEAQK